jgi:formylglycine-generating enzyme required for sulfatase activity
MDDLRWPPPHLCAGVDVQFPWESAPHRVHAARLSVPAFFIDVHPVTCGEYAAFLEKSGYHPADGGEHFLHNWKKEASSEKRGGEVSQHRFTPPDGHWRKPVTYVGLEDARAYCKAAGKRLPHAWEWSLAGGHADGRKYPWGDEEPTEANGVSRPP